MHLATELEVSSDHGNKVSFSDVSFFLAVHGLLPAVQVCLAGGIDPAGSVTSQPEVVHVDGKPVGETSGDSLDQSVSH